MIHKMRGLRYSQQCCCGFGSSGMWCCVVQWEVPGILKDRSAFIFKAKQSEFLVPLLDPEDIQNLTNLSCYHTASHLTSLKTNIGHEMCVAVVVQLLSETSFLLMNIYRVTCKSHLRCMKKNYFVQFLPKFELLVIF